MKEDIKACRECLWSYVKYGKEIGYYCGHPSIKNKLVGYDYLNGDEIHLENTIDEARKGRCGHEAKFFQGKCG